MAPLPIPSAHVFISYAREDHEPAAWLKARLERAGMRMWMDTEDLAPGQLWEDAIIQAIEDQSIAFLACFSSQSVNRPKSYQRKEIELAIRQLQLRPYGTPWMFPVRFDECEIPRVPIGLDRRLNDLQSVDIFGSDRHRGVERLIASLRGIDWPPSSAESVDAQLRNLRRGYARSTVWFDGEEFDDPDNLARVLQRKWPKSQHGLFESPDGILIDEMQSFLSGRGIVEAGQLLRPESSQFDASVNLARFLVAISPEIDPTYKGLDLRPEELLEAALTVSEARGRHGLAVTIGEVARYEILRRWRALPGLERGPQIQLEWFDKMNKLAHLLTQLSHDCGVELTSSDLASAHSTLLAITLDPAYAGSLKVELASLDSAASKSQEWWASIAENAESNQISLVAAITSHDFAVRRAVKQEEQGRKVRKEEVRLKKLARRKKELEARLADTDYQIDQLPVGRPTFKSFAKTALCSAAIGAVIIPPVFGLYQSKEPTWISGAVYTCVLASIVWVLLAAYRYIKVEERLELMSTRDEIQHELEGLLPGQRQDRSMYSRRHVR